MYTVPTHDQSYCGLRIEACGEGRLPMKRIEQRKSNDCGVACVAMIIQRYAGCPPRSSYGAAKAIFDDLEVDGRTQTRDLRRALRCFGVELGHRRVPFRKTSPADMGLDFDAIIATKANAHGNWHWLVWDSKQKILFDPNPNKKTNSHKAAYHYIRIMAPD